MAPLTVLYRKDDHIATITLNRPEVRNAVDEAMAASLDEAIHQAEKDDEVWVVVITANGESFCAGQDLRTIASGSADQKGSASTGVNRRGHIGWSSYRIYALEKPTIAAVRGHAYGGGLGIALACDVRIASTDAQFCAVFARRGLAPDSGTSYLLPKLVGYAKACELGFTTKAIGAEEAQRIGMVNQVVPPDQVEIVAHEMATAIVQQAPVAVRMAKRGFRRGEESEVVQAYEYELYVNGICARTEDVLEGSRAFIEKRPPVWRGM